MIRKTGEALIIAMNKFQELRKEFYLEMPKYTPTERVLGFIKFCRQIVDAKQKNEISLLEAGQLLFLGHHYDEDLTAYYKDSPEAYPTDEILEIADNMDTLPGYYPEGLSIESDWKRVEEIVSHYK